MDYSVCLFLFADIRAMLLAGRKCFNQQDTTYVSIVRKAEDKNDLPQDISAQNYQCVPPESGHRTPKRSTARLYGQIFWKRAVTRSSFHTLHKNYNFVWCFQNYAEWYSLFVPCYLSFMTKLLETKQTHRERVRVRHFVVSVLPSIT